MLRLMEAVNCGANHVCVAEAETPEELAEKAKSALSDSDEGFHIENEHGEIVWV